MSQAVFVLKVGLSGCEDIWRRIAVRGSQTLDDLHEAIFDAFDRYDEHLYSFYFPKPGSRGRARKRDGKEYTSSVMAEEESAFGEDDAPGNAEDTRMDSLGLKPRRKFHYLFDFGDEWWHDITVEQIDAPAERGKYPRILQKQGESPPQYPDSDEMDD
ncbi:MAG: hypothetical protein A2V70_06020 [Planctomycetes bacterium RBG_13_63_9]|nr:MAG: hypothetical protein A2V70_06020 [Planctomycetes bacterium RBG_13_63_9]